MTDEEIEKCYEQASDSKVAALLEEKLRVNNIKASPKLTESFFEILEHSKECVKLTILLRHGFNLENRKYTWPQVLNEANKLDPHWPTTLSRLKSSENDFWRSVRINLQRTLFQFRCNELYSIMTRGKE